MRRRWRTILAVAASAYLLVSIIAGVVLAEGSLRLPRRRMTAEQLELVLRKAAELKVSGENVAIGAADGVELKAWLARPEHPNGSAAILLHGVTDNRLGMAGTAELLLRRGYTVLAPDSRAHGESGGELATYGWREADDIHRWVSWLIENEKPKCVYGWGGSMGAAQLLQSLAREQRYCAVIAEAAFADFREIAFDRAGNHVRAPWAGRTVLRPAVEVALAYARWRYDLPLERVSPAEAVAGSQVPVLLIHGTRDISIPVRHAHMIQRRNPQAVRLWEVAEADHAGAWRVAPEEYTRRVEEQLGFSRGSGAGSGR